LCLKSQSERWKATSFRDLNEVAYLSSYF
jgi:hypothetical protein